MSATIHRGQEPPASTGGTWIPAPRSRDLALPPGALFAALAQEGADPARLDAVARTLHAERRRTLDALKESFAQAAEDPAARKAFLQGFLQVMREGEYGGLDAETYARATDQRFLLDIPVRVSWSALDPRWLAEAKKDPAVAAELDALDLPEAFRDRALFFYRGFLPQEAKGWYVAAKLDLLLMRILSGGPLRRLFTRKPPEHPPAKAERWLRRVGLADTPWHAGLLHRATLHEPCFRQVVLLYRPSRGEGGLTLKLFRDIPLADAEMVFPKRKLGIRGLDALLIAVTALAATPAIIKAIMGGSGTAIALAIALGGYATKLVGQYLQKRGQHRARLTATLYDKSQDTDVGVLQYLVDAGLTQSVAEVALAHHHLTKSGPLTPEALDARIEGWLEARFGVDPDYDVQDALTRAQALGLVRDDGDGRWSAAAPAEADAKLAEAWARLARPV